MAGPQKDHWTAQRYNTNANFVYSNAAASAVVSLLDPKPGVRREPSLSNFSLESTC